MCGGLVVVASSWVCSLWLIPMVLGDIRRIRSCRIPRTDGHILLLLIGLSKCGDVCGRMKDNSSWVAYERIRSGGWSLILLCNVDCAALTIHPIEVVSITEEQAGRELVCVSIPLCLVALSAVYGSVSHEEPQ